METRHEHEQRPAVEEFAQMIDDVLAYEQGEEVPEWDRRLEALDRDIAQAWEEIRDYLAAMEEWELAYNTWKAVGTLEEDAGIDAPAHIRDELEAADARLEKAVSQVGELKEKALPVITHIIRLRRIREELAEKLKGE